MNGKPITQIPFLATMVLFLGAASGLTQVKTGTVPLDAPDELKLRNVKTEMVTYKDHRALRVTDAAPPEVGDGDRLVIDSAKLGVPQSVQKILSAVEPT